MTKLFNSFDLIVDTNTFLLEDLPLESVVPPFFLVYTLTIGRIAWKWVGMQFVFWHSRGQKTSLGTFLCVCACVCVRYTPSVSAADMSPS